MNAGFSKFANVKSVLCAAAAATVALVAGGKTYAASNDLSLAPNLAPVYADDAPKTPLMKIADYNNVLSDHGISVGGWAEASYTYSLDHGPGGALTGRVFDTKEQDLDLNQVGVFFNKNIDSKKSFDVGGRVELTYGSDSKFIHASGLNFYGPDGTASPDEQLDITQAYVDIGFGAAGRLRVGKFVTLLGQEVINPTGNVFYSHAYLFGFAIPFTQTGATYQYTTGDGKWVFEGGFTRGWEQALKDNNGDSIDFLGQVTYNLSDKTSIKLGASVGPQLANDSGNYRTVIDLIVSHKVSDQLSLAFNADYGYGSSEAIGGDTGQWYGGALYASYMLDKYVTFNGRGEIFSDTDGARGLDTVVYEATLGATITPLPDNDLTAPLKLRPEFRYDYANDAIFNGGTDNNQWTVAIDAIYSF